MPLPSPHHIPTHHTARAARTTRNLSALLLPSLLLLLTTASPAAACPNQQAREQNNSTNLPDCRAYEMVSPLDKNGGDISTINTTDNGGVIQATPDGTKITYASLTAFGNPLGAAVGSQYLSTDTPEGWTTQNITLPFENPNRLSNRGTSYKAFNTNLTEGLLLNTPSEEIEEPPVGGAPAGYRDYYTHNLTNNTNQALLTTTPPIPPANFNNADGELNIEGYATTPDLKHTILTSENNLIPGTITVGGGGLNLYESIPNGQLELINVPPHPVVPGEILPEAKLGSSLTMFGPRTISSDGSRAFWSIEHGRGSLFVREGIGTQQARTVEVDTGIGGEGYFLTASSDGSKVFFTKNTGAGHITGVDDLYEYDLGSETVSDLTPTAAAGEAAVLGVLGASEDGNYVYFVASGALRSGGSSAECCDLYVWHTGTPIAFIASLSAGDAENDWAENSFAKETTRVSPDGRYVVFVSEAPLTSYDNAGHDEVYEYEAGSVSPVCVSCNPNGAAAVGSSSIPPPTKYEVRSAVYESRALSSDGSRVFFDTSEALVDADTDGTQDVYEWERSGTGTCSLAAGCVSLISGGVSSEDSSFADASENGSDVFFTTRQQLTPGDTDQEADLYDARVDGGVTVPSTTACTGTGCQGLPLAPPVFEIPPTVTATGVGNFPAPPKVTAKPKALTRAQKLAAALKVCAKKPKKQRASCQKRAHARYPAAKSKTTKS
jgi:WD40-like Beta Propeller Repeat